MLSSKALALCGLAALLLVAFPALGEAQATVTLTVPDGAAAEAGQDPASFTATRTTDAGTDLNLRVYLQRSGNATTADFGTVNLSAVGGDVYYARIPFGQTSITFTATPKLDNIVEGDETLAYTIIPSQLVGNDYIIGSPSFGEAAIADDVATVHLTLDDAEAAEAGKDPAGFTITRSNQGNMTLQLRVYMQIEGTAQRDLDYAISANATYQGGTTWYATIPPNESSTSVTFTPKVDNLLEGDETISFNLLAPQQETHGYTIGVPNAGAATIADDVAVVHLTVDDAEAAEAGADPAGFTVTRSSQGNLALSLRVYLQVGGTAQRVLDFSTGNLFYSEGTTWYVVIPANQSSISATIVPSSDNLIEGEETMSYSLLGPLLAGNDYTIGAPESGDATLSDDVAVITLTVDDAEAAELNQNTGAFTLARSNQGNVDDQLRVYLEVTGTAAVLYDYDIAQLHLAGGSIHYITLPAHQLSYSYTLVPDFEEIEEGDESAVFTVVGPQLEGHGYIVGAPATGAITIRDFIDFIFGDGFENH